MTTLLKVDNLYAYYDGTPALHGISFEVKKGTVLTLIGANGAGKTTTLRAISQLIDTKGLIEFDGQSIIGKKPFQTARMGIAHVPEGRGTFEELTVAENLQIGALTNRDFSQIEEDIAHIYDYFPVLKERRKQLAGYLSGGEQQMLAISRAMLLRPQLLMLDEPSTGLSPKYIQDIFAILSMIKEKFGVTILLVEQNVNLALELADYACVLETGNIVLSGTAEYIADHPDIQQSYLGY